MDEDKDDGDSNDRDSNDQNNLILEYDKMPPVKVIEDGVCYITPPVIWVGVLPNMLTNAVTNNLATKILGIISWHGVSSVEVAFRESVVHNLRGPGLVAPVDNDDHHKCHD